MIPLGLWLLSSVVSLRISFLQVFLFWPASLFSFFSGLIIESQYTLTSYSKSALLWHHIFPTASFQLTNGLNKRVLYTHSPTSHFPLTLKYDSCTNSYKGISMICMVEAGGVILSSFLSTVTFDTTDHFLEFSLLTFMMPHIPNFPSASLSLSPVVLLVLHSWSNI